MASIFKKDDNFVDKPNRNTFDLSFQNNLTMKFGKLIPCMCQEVLPGDSFQIEPTFGLRYLPQVFPVQTRMRAHLHFFYVRNRTIWKDWMDFIGKTKDNLVVPYLQSENYTEVIDDYYAKADKNFTESSIYDYMGLPVVVDSASPVANYNLYSSNGNNVKVEFYSNGHIYRPSRKFSSVNLTLSEVGSNNSYFQDSVVGSLPCSYMEYVKPISVPLEYDQQMIFIQTNHPDTSDFNNLKVFLYCDVRDDENIRKAYIQIPFNIKSTLQFALQQNVIGLNERVSQARILKIYGYIVVAVDGSGSVLNHHNNLMVSVQIQPQFNRNYPFSGLSANTLPYGSGDFQYRINALPFRAYEAVYNSFYRNAENNPFKIDGVNEYNKYVQTMEGGAQSSSMFKLFNRNWEDDAFTTAVPTPQQGDAPRVGLTGNPNQPLALRVYDEDGNISTVNLVANENGQVTIAEGFSGDTNNLVNALNDAVNFGITINDLRNVNALQLWLEKNVRKGYKYRDQMLSHYGVAIDYDDLMIPEFIGGVSRDVTVNQISQTVETSTGNLGDMAGQAYVVGNGEKIRHYCPEHGYIIGIVSIVPVPNYSQLIPKHFFKHDAFDYFFPEFGKIGMQPITKKEIAATAAWLSHKGDETFGYQRAWYDYLANVDQVHGKFNSDFYDFLIQRKFDEVPELGESFTTVINEQLNDIFYTKSDEDKILGQIYFDIKAIRPIPLYGIPSLE